MIGGFRIRPARPGDAPALWAILEPVIRAGDTYALDPAMGQAEALAYWTGPDRDCFVAEEGGRALGTYYLRANAAGGGGGRGPGGGGGRPPPAGTLSGRPVDGASAVASAIH